MKHFLSLVLLAATLCPSVRGNTYFGSFSVSYTDLRSFIVDEGVWITGIEGIEMGETFSGHYRYESPSIDGFFTRSAQEGSFQGEMYIPGPFNSSGLGEFADIYRSSLSVSDNGLSVALSLGFDAGATCGNFYGTSFNLVRAGFGPVNYFAQGTITYGAPSELRLEEEASYRVPDVANTLGMILLSFSGLILGRRWTKSNRVEGQF